MGFTITLGVLAAKLISYVLHRTNPLLRQKYKFFDVNIWNGSSRLEAITRINYSLFFLTATFNMHNCSRIEMAFFLSCQRNYTTPFPWLLKRVCALKTSPDLSVPARCRDAERLITAAQSSSPPSAWIKEISICYYQAKSHALFQLEGF